MNAHLLDLAIINNWCAVRSHPYKVLSQAFFEVWNKCAMTLALNGQRKCSNLTQFLECFLQISDQRAPETFDASSFRVWDRYFKQLLGAICSEKFYCAKPSARVAQMSILLSMRRKMAAEVGALLTWDASEFSKFPEKTEPLTRLFETMPLNPGSVVIWQGWPCRSKSGAMTSVKLLPLHTSFGAEFTEMFYEACKAYFGARHRTRLTGAHAFSEFIAETNHSFTIESLADEIQTTELFKQIYEHYLRSAYKDGDSGDIGRVINLWRCGVKTFFYDYVFATGLIAKPKGTFPMPAPVNRKHEPTHIRSSPDGEIHEKLLTPVPLTVSDEEAMHLIFTQIKSDLDAAKEWAWNEVVRVAHISERRKILAKQGKVRTIESAGRHTEKSPTSWEHADHLKNAAATYESHGYPCSLDIHALHLLFPRPASRWVEELAIPATGALLPHCAVIVGEHPQITPAFFEEHQLYNKEHKLSGLVQTDGGEILVGDKRRRGAELAEQRITLNERSAFALKQIIILTTPLRDYLRMKGDDNWRYLLLTAGKGFAYPRRVNRIASLSSTPASLLRLKTSARRAGMNEVEAERFSDRFSLATLRASAGTLVFIETKSVEKMAKALGHAKYEPALLDRYLPKVLRDFFQERWIRIFQTGIIVQALQESKHLLKASGFSSMREVDLFLGKHALHIPLIDRDISDEPTEDAWSIGDIKKRREVVFSLNEEVLTLMLSISLAAEQPARTLSPHARYWAEMTNALVPYIQSASNHRTDIREFLSSAKKNASASLVENIAYE
ncbi:hypothetical protein N0K08_11910 [Acidovorax sp. Be4]|uniref:Uncharacterized protein n=1 Tax=Acidovorax bellezanensis TaxID=2976702 RepID=A0ABT2PLJ6_9BURK|nr:hypothetical protein [Acidovorax sp. Be4]MCT9811344.1 hypothetical protein [Acidovorax sp. Be4]